MQSPIKSLLVALLGLALLWQQASALCTYNGVRYRHGDEWIVRRSFVMRCEDIANNYWETKVIACISLMGVRIPVGEEFRDRHGLWRCIQDANGTVRMVQNPEAK